MSWGIQRAASFRNPECRAEYGTQLCDILRLLLLTYTQSIGDQRPTGKQGVGTVLFSMWGRPVRHPCRPGML